MNLFEKILLNENQVIEKILTELKNDNGFLLTYFNVHSYNTYFSNNEYRDLINNEFIIYPDGIGIWLLLKRLKKYYKRFNATDMNYKIISHIKKIKKSFLIIGGNYEHDIILTKCKKSGLKCEGYINGFVNDYEIFSSLNNYSTDLIFIGAGVPKQELLAYKISKIDKSKKIICVGNFFNFYFNFQKRAPKFIQKLGFEWLFRFLQEPKRLFRRYTIGNIKFLINVINIKNEKVIKYQ